MTDLVATGRRVLDALANGRQKLLERRRRRLKVVRAIVAYEIKRDAAAGNPERGRPSRIAKRLAGVSRPMVFRVYRTLVSVGPIETSRMRGSKA